MILFLYISYVFSFSLVSELIYRGIIWFEICSSVVWKTKITDQVIIEDFM